MAIDIISGEEYDRLLTSIENDPTSRLGGNLAQQQERTLPPNAKVMRAWTQRTSSGLATTENQGGCRSYVPQVGDTVMYIPEAHVPTIVACEAAGEDEVERPWEGFPDNHSTKTNISLSWAIVKCNIEDIVYCFPHFTDEEVKHVRKKAKTKDRNSKSDEVEGVENLKKSIIANISLKIIGVPSINQNTDNSFPWLKQKFVDPCSEDGAGIKLNTSSLAFDLNFFPNDQPEYLIPECLFNWRLRQLESAVVKNDGVARGIDLITFFAQVSASNVSAFDTDPIYEPSHCRIGSILDSPSQKIIDNNIHLQNSGFECIEVRYRNYFAPLRVCPWEVDVDAKLRDTNIEYNPPKLSKADKDQVLMIIDDAIRNIPGVSEFENVNNVEDHVVEIPMSIHMIRLRLEGFYYTNKLSILADIKVIMNNCFKLKKSSEVCVAASELFELFKNRLNVQLENDNKTNSTSDCLGDYLDQRFHYSERFKTNFWSPLSRAGGEKWKGVSFIEQEITKSLHIENDSSVTFDAIQLLATSTMCSTLSDRALILEIIRRQLKAEKGSNLVHKFMSAGGLRVITSWLAESITPVLVKKRIKQNELSRVPSPTGPLLISILNLLEEMPFDLELIKESQVDKRIRRLKKSIDANISDSNSLQALLVICGGIDPKSVQKATDSLYDTWKTRHMKGLKVSYPNPFSKLQQEVKIKLKELKEFESRGERAPWLEKLDSVKNTDISSEKPVFSRETKAKQIAARKRSQELKEGQAFREQAKKNRLEMQKALSEELAEEYKRKRDAWKVEREKSKIKLLQRDKVVDVPSVVKGRRVRWNDKLVTLHTYEIEPNIEEK